MASALTPAQRRVLALWCAGYVQRIDLWLYEIAEAGTGEKEVGK